jgi:hypothetical protein
MNTKTKMLASLLAAAGLFHATSAVVQAGGLNQAKIRAGAWVVPTTPEPTRPARMAAPPLLRRMPRESPLSLRVYPADTASQEPVAIFGSAGETLRLTLEIANQGPATDVRLAALTAGLKAELPPSISVEANSTTTVSLQITIRDCGARPNLLQIFAGEGKVPADRSTRILRTKITCR